MVCTHEPNLSNSRRWIKISSQTHMDLCSTKHTCSNSACQMFADKWVVLTNTSIKKLYQINNDKGNWQNIQNRQMSDHSRGVSTGVESNAGPYWSALCYGSLLSCAALRSQCRSIRCGDSGHTKNGYVNTHIYMEFSQIFISYDLPLLSGLNWYCFNITAAST